MVSVHESTNIVTVTWIARGLGCAPAAAEDVFASCAETQASACVQEEILKFFKISLL